MTACSKLAHHHAAVVLRNAPLLDTRFSGFPKQLKMISSYKGKSALPHSGPLSLKLQAVLPSYPPTSSIPVFAGEHCGLSRTTPLSLNRRRHAAPCSAYTDFYIITYPEETAKPKWWWRSISCLPYLMALHEAWLYAENAYTPHPLQESFELLTHPFLLAVGRLPGWFITVFFTVVYLGIVKRKEWPHFFRFHVVMGILLDVLVQVTGIASGWFPLNIFGGKFGMYYWIAVALAFSFPVLECIRCALAGIYPDLPFVCEAAYFHTSDT